jgi:hypothetical protein
MKQRTKGYNPKRRIALSDSVPRHRLSELARMASYGGNPEHKRSPGDYGLTPPASPRPGKTLCDAQGQFLKDEAEALLRAGLRKGMMSPSPARSWPQNVWALSEAGEAFEAQLENPTLGVYHGYPMPLSDDFRAAVQAEWNKR